MDTPGWTVESVTGWWRWAQVVLSQPNWTHDRNPCGRYQIQASTHGVDDGRHIDVDVTV